MVHFNIKNLIKCKGSTLLLIQSQNYSNLLCKDNEIMKDAHAQQYSESFSQPINNAQSLTWLHIPAYAE